MQEIILNVKGMMCEACENRIKNVVKNIDGVEEANADHKTGKVIITINKDIEKETISEAIDDIGYEVIRED